MNEPLQITLIDALAMLQAEDIACALVGGLAVSLRGQSRSTVDVDLVIDASVEQALLLVGHLDATPFIPLFDGIAEVVETAFILPLRHRPSGVKLDLALGLSGFEKQAIARSEPMQIAGSTVPVVTPEDLLVMKALAFRPQDQQDMRGLAISQAGQIDWEDCLALARQLGEALGEDLVSRIQAARDGQL